MNSAFDMMNDPEAMENFKNNSLQILDAGCGPAGIFLILAHHRVDALDPLVNTYEQFRLLNKMDYRSVNFIPRKLESFTSKEVYDFIFCMNCINHLHDVELGMKKIFLALKKEGFLILTVDVHKYSFAKAFFKIIPADILHPHQLSPDDCTALIKRNFGDRNIKSATLSTGVLFDHLLIVARKQHGH